MTGNAPKRTFLTGAPSVGKPESLTSFAEATEAYPIGGTALPPTAFQSVHPREAVLLPERFRGGCSFGDPSPKTRILSRDGGRSLATPVNPRLMAE
jgi:hypothetical protein